MNNKISKHVDSLFADIPDSGKLRELKEELTANLTERIADSINRGKSEAEAFKEAKADLGDVSELADSMRKVTNVPLQESIFYSQPLDKKHVIGYVTASAIILFGLMTAGIVQLKNHELFQTISTLMPFVIISAGLFVFFGLTHESRYQYGMNTKRALAYSVASVFMLFGLMTAGILYFQGQELWIVISALIPFVLPAAVAFIYLGLTEKSRMKMDNVLVREWMEKWSTEWQQYSNPHYSPVRGGISGALWLFSIAIFILLILTGYWKFSWIVFIFACGIEALIEAVFAHKLRSNL